MMPYRLSSLQFELSLPTDDPPRCESIPKPEADFTSFKAMNRVEMDCIVYDPTKPRRDDKGMDWEMGSRL